MMATLVPGAFAQGVLRTAPDVNVGTPGARNVPSQSAPSPRSVQPARSGNYLLLKKVYIMDQSGFERPIPSSSLLLPADWQTQGGTTWNVKDNCNPIRTSFRAAGPDGRGFEMFPPYAWAWADDPRPLQVLAAQKAQVGGHACDVMPPMSAADYIRRTLPQIRRDAQVVAMEPLPKAMQALQQQARQTEQTAAQYGLRQRVRSDVVRARVRYSLNGQPMEEWVIGTTVITGTMGPSMTPTGQMTQAFSYSCQASAFAERAPQGKLDSYEKFFDMVLGTLRVNAAWQQRVNGVSASVFKTEHQGIADRVAINTKLAHDLDDIRQKQYDNQQRVEDHVFAQFSQATLGLETYRNPASGETFDLSNQYRNAWVNNRNEVVMTDEEGWDPNVALKGDWTRLQPVRQ
jgi:hypothetical protein